MYRLVLDEATSSIDKDTEEHLYQLIMENNTAVISVSHHTNVIGLHNVVVKLDGTGNYTIHNNDGDGSTSSSLVAV
jgi:ABC-type uncharacterized transport system fused permease/ATPase subunit